MAQSKVWLLTELTPVEYSLDRSQCWIKASGHQKETLMFTGSQSQMINIRALQNQQLPIAVMVDNYVALHTQFQIPPSAMLGILPVPAAGLQSLIETGQADAWLAKQVS